MDKREFKNKIHDGGEYCVQVDGHIWSLFLLSGHYYVQKDTEIPQVHTEFNDAVCYLLSGIGRFK